jgi:N-dimethylarginine dimethylaminohydrolase
VTEEDAVAFACNAVNLGDTVILNAASESLARTLASRGFLLQRVPLGEFMRAGGAAKCLTLRLDESGDAAGRRETGTLVAEAA